jgi:4-oxalocrotonate tautomerase family enzyme
MPVIEVHLLEGYTPDSKQRLGEVLTDACRMVVPAPADAVTIMIHEMARTDYYRGRTQRTPAAALPDPCVIVHQFLEHLGARDLDAARHLLADDFTMVFPDTTPMSNLDELVTWSATRYRSIAKHFETTEAMGSASGATIVYCRGTLHGECPDGTPFQDIRFIDRFELVNGKITRQDVWNDLAEVRFGRAGTR